MTVSKALLFNGREKTVVGLSEDDPYFRELTTEAYADVEAICRSVLKPGAVCWDIGANIGVTAQIMDACAPGARITALEPGAGTFDRLERTIAANGTEGTILAIRAAAGGSVGEIGFVEASAYGHIDRDSPKVRMIDAPTLLRESGSDRVDFVKIDIEGFELPFLRSGMDIFRANRTVVFTEFNVWCQLMSADVHPRDAMAWIVENFPYHYLSSQGSVTPFDKATWMQTLEQIIVHRNAIADIIMAFDPLDIR